jgi:AraC-like DNA-binding protein
LLLGSLLQPEVARDDPGQFILARALAYIEQHLSSALTVPDIARNAGTSERRLYVLLAAPEHDAVLAYREFAPESGH